MLKAVLFDMDGVLYDSMPSHARAWQETFLSRDIPCTYEEFYLHEGRPGFSTINLVFQRTFNRDASQEEIQEIYKQKSDLFKQYDKQVVMPGIQELLAKVKACGLQMQIVTGSGQASLLENLNKHFPGYFTKELMVTAYDVKHGKPHPEPYLQGLKKGGILPHEAIVVENAPMGVESSVAAGIYTVAVNTGPMPSTVLSDAGANSLYPSMQAFADDWEAFFERMNENFKKTGTS